MERLETVYLLIAGAVALLIGSGMVIMPATFYGSYGIDPSGSVANELRSPGLWLVLAGLAIGLGTFKRDIRHVSLGIAAALYLSYAAARGVSIVADGLPGPGLLIAMASEVLLGIGGTLLFWRQRSTAR